MNTQAHGRGILQNTHHVSEKRKWNQSQTMHGQTRTKNHTLKRDMPTTTNHPTNDHVRFIPTGRPTNVMHDKGTRSSLVHGHDGGGEPFHLRVTRRQHHANPIRAKVARHTRQHRLQQGRHLRLGVHVRRGDFCFVCVGVCILPNNPCMDGAFFLPRCD